MFPRSRHDSDCSNVFAKSMTAWALGDNLEFYQNLIKSLQSLCNEIIFQIYVSVYI